MRSNNPLERFMKLEKVEYPELEQFEGIKVYNGKDEWRKAATDRPSHYVLIVDKNFNFYDAFELFSEDDPIKIYPIQNKEFWVIEYGRK